MQLGTIYCATIEIPQLGEFLLYRLYCCRYIRTPLSGQDLLFTHNNDKWRNLKM